MGAMWASRLTDTGHLRSERSLSDMGEPLDDASCLRSERSLGNMGEPLDDIRRQRTERGHEEEVVELYPLSETVWSRCRLVWPMRITHWV